VHGEEKYGEAFLRGSARRDREAGLDWLDALRHRLVPEQDESVQAALNTWFHLAGGAKRGVEGGG